MCRNDERKFFYKKEKKGKQVLKNKMEMTEQGTVFLKTIQTYFIAPSTNAGVG